MKVLVVGGHGFVGNHLVEALKRSSYDVYARSRRDGVDLTNYGITKKCLKDISPDVIINSAAHTGSLHYVTTYASDVFHDNCQMNLNLYKSVSEICPDVKIINLLSNCSYPGESDIQSENNWLSGEVHESVFSYGNVKRFAYVISKCYNIQQGIRSTNILIPNTFGPGDYTDPNRTHALNGMIIRMILSKRQHKNVFEIWGTGKPIREWAYISDVVQLILKSIETNQELIYPVNLAQNRGYSIKESAEMIASALDYDVEIVFNSNYSDGAPVKILDNKKFNKLFPEFKFYDHNLGIIETVEYYNTVL